MAENETKPARDAFHQYVVNMETIMATMGLSLHDKTDAKPKYIAGSSYTDSESAEMQEMMLKKLTQGLVKVMKGAGSGKNSGNSRFSVSDGQVFSDLASMLGQSIRRNR